MFGNFSELSSVSSTIHLHLKQAAGICAIAAWAGLILQLGLLLARTPENGLTPAGAIGRFLLFFTILSNIWVAVASTSLLLGRRNCFTRPLQLSAVAVYIIVVALVYNVVLRSLWAPKGADWVADNLLHVLVPVCYLWTWWRLPNKPVSWKFAIVWLWFPAVYLIYALLRGMLENFYPYPFIDLNKLGTTKVLVNSSFVLLLFVTIGLLIVFISRLQAGKHQLR